MTSISDVSLIIKTFERKEALRRLLSSIADQGYDHLPVLIADDSKAPYREEILSEFGDLVDEYVVLPFDSGISKGRNELLKRVDTKYFVLNDDDYVYGEITDIEGSIQDLSETGADILCGYYVNKVESGIPFVPDVVTEALGIQKERWKEEVWAGNINETQDGGISIQSVEKNPPHLQECDIGINFFIANTKKVIKSVEGWNESLKTQEHWDFFYRCKESGLDVFFTRELGVYHIQESSPKYDKYRHDRRNKMMKKSLSDNGFEYMIRGGNKFDP
jgi:GT2 family glycosyltransferase